MFFSFQICFCVWLRKHDADDDDDDKFTVKSFADAFKQTRCRLGEVYV